MNERKRQALGDGGVAAECLVALFSGESGVSALAGASLLADALIAIRAGRVSG